MKYLFLNKYWEINKEYNKEKLLYLLIDRPDKISIYGHFFWINNKNQDHRNYDLPAIIYDNGNVWWCSNNKNHREGKPALICANEYKEYWSNGRRLKIEHLK